MLYLLQLMVKRKKKLGPVLSKAAAANEDGADPIDELNSESAAQPSRRSPRQPSKRSSRRPNSKPRGSGSPRSRPASGDADDYDDYAIERPRSAKKPTAARPTTKPRRGDKYDPISGALDSTAPQYSDDDEGEVPRDDEDATGDSRPRARAARPGPARSAPKEKARGRKPVKGGAREDDPVDPEEYEEVDDGDDDDDDDDYEDLGEEVEPADGEIRPERRPGAPATGHADLLRERKAVRREFERVRAQITADDVLLRMRRQQAAELGNSALECEESIEQARTWIKALEDVLQKRTVKLTEHDAKRAKSAQQVSESERALELLEEEERRNSARHVQDQASLANTVKVLSVAVSVPSPASLSLSLSLSLSPSPSRSLSSLRPVFCFLAVCHRNSRPFLISNPLPALSPPFSTFFCALKPRPSVNESPGCAGVASTIAVVGFCLPVGAAAAHAPRCGGVGRWSRRRTSSGGCWRRSCGGC